MINPPPATIRESSDYRPQIMGAAILTIMGYHAGLIPEGGFGVEVFLIVSGLGIYFSLKKNEKLGLVEFYKRRAIRILPYYLLIATIFYLFVLTIVR